MTRKVPHYVSVTEPNERRIKEPEYLVEGSFGATFPFTVKPSEYVIIVTAGIIFNPPSQYLSLRFWISDSPWAQPTYKVGTVYDSFNLRPQGTYYVFYPEGKDKPELTDPVGYEYIQVPADKELFANVKNISNGKSRYYMEITEFKY